MSQPAYDHKYSDRDVRENPELREIALKYIHQYGGSFEPLLRVKHFLSRNEDDDLTTAQIRLILNCMRHDAAVAADMPAPQFPFIVEKRSRDAVVIPIQRSRRKHVGEVQCDNPEPHEYHTDRTEGSWCHGVPFPINRVRAAVTRGRLKTKNFAASKTGALVHKMTGEAKFMWRPYPHAWGFVEHPVSVSVKTFCKNPSWLHDAHLFTEEPIHLYADEVFAKERCSRCFTVSELREGPRIPKQRAPQPVFLPPVCMIPDCGCSGLAHA